MVPGFRRTCEGLKLEETERVVDGRGFRRTCEGLKRTHVFALAAAHGVFQTDL